MEDILVIHVFYMCRYAKDLWDKSEEHLYGSGPGNRSFLDDLIVEVQQILGEVVSGVVVEPEVVQKACVEEDRVLPWTLRGVSLYGLPKSWPP